ncbi:MAG: iron uptake porin [Myxacorys chilensis ATA2-1-KO14]|jgi:hypothetical protein|nr:iron uptake porin [Myxacorys chilensis ATA2-1-KO14]
MNKVHLCIVGSLCTLSIVTQHRQASAGELGPILDNSSESEPQVTSVSQLSDVQPTDWAFQALQSLVERYGTIAGYPDKTFRGNRAMTRYEFAAGLNAALDRVNELIQAGLADKVRQEDLATLQRLQEEFKTELAALKGRVDALESGTAKLESQQFSTTTKLRGQVIFSVNGGTQAGDSANPVFLQRSRLNLETSFSGKDLLLTQLQAGTPNADAAGFLQQENRAFNDRFVQLREAEIQRRFERIFFPLSSLGVTLDDLGIGLARFQTVDEVRDAYAGIIATLSLEEGASPSEALSLRQTLLQGIESSRRVSRFLQTNSALDYSNNVTSGLSVNRLSYTVPISQDLQVSFFPQGYISDYVDFNRYANNRATNFSTYGLVNNQLLLANDAPGAGAALHWNPGQSWFTFNAAYRAEQSTLTTSTSVFDSNTERGGIFDAPNLGIVELGFAPSKAVAIRLQYSGGTQAGSRYEVLGANLELALGKHLGLFGRFGYAFNFPGDVQAIAWSAGLAFPDTFRTGDLAGISVGQPLSLQDDLLGFFNAKQTNYEAFYRFRVNDSVSISPAFQVITNPSNLKGDTIFTATLRTVFSF